MGKDLVNISTSLLMRVGSTKSIEKCYRDRTLQFSCAANWINYAITNGDYSIGDPEECIFARITKDTPIDIKDSKGIPMKNNLIITDCQTQNIRHLRFAPTILMPALCFYNIDLPTLIRKHHQANTIIGINLNKYCIDMGMEIKDCSFILIKNPNAFYDDLYKSVPKACEKNSEKLTTKSFYKSDIPLEPIVIRAIDYHKHRENEYFFDLPEEREEIFWKMPRYEYQAEVRAVIPGINFITPEIEDDKTESNDLCDSRTNDVVQNERLAFNLNNNKYDFKSKRLAVELPHFQEYTEIFPASNVHTLLFWNIKEKGKSFCMKKSTMTYQELSQRKLYPINTEIR